LPSYLDPRVGSVVDLIFDVDMMARELKDLDVDIRKMPLGTTGFIFGVLKYFRKDISGPTYTWLRGA
jgi:hypothetical protein